MYHIVICDDEIQILNTIHTKVKSCFDKANITAEYQCLSDARELMNLLYRENPDLLLLDIDMPYFSGMDIAGFILEKNIKTILIFITSHDALVYQSFAYKPFGFIRKSHIDDELPELAERIKKELNDRRQELTVTKGQEITKIKIRKIVYIEAERNYLNICTDEDTIKIRETMTSIENELKYKGFVRCHKGYLVNSEYITKMKTSELEVRFNGGSISIPIGRSYEKDVRQKILASMRN